jgi:multicomponent Na+:H+ antiporter subunit E
VRAVVLTFVLAATWLLWSGHWHEPFLLGMGVISCALVLACCWALRILDHETVPIHWGLRPFVQYAPWLTKEIVISNIDVLKRLVQHPIPIRPRMLNVPVGHLSELGRTVLANSITLTPGTVSVEMNSDYIRVHSLAFGGEAAEMTREMERRIARLEGRA